MAQEYKHILVETNSAGVTTLTLNRPDRLNAVNVQLSNEIPQAIEAAGKDEATRVIVVTGSGRGFCAGLDLSQDNLSDRTEQRSGRKALLDDFGWVGRMAMAAVNCEKPIIAAINGPAAGAGLGLALAADIRLMKAGAVVTTGYLRRGLSPDAGVSYFLPRLVGTSRATELILSARDITSEEAERIGLVSRVLDADSFGEAVAEYAAQIAGGAPIALAYTKRLLAESITNDLPAQLRAEYSYIAKCFQTEDVGEAMRAFQEKRKPNFKGK